MEALDVEALAELFLRRCTHPLDLEASDHVGQRLTRHRRDVAVDLFRDRVHRHRRVLSQVIDGLLAGPSESVDSGVDDEATGTHRVCREHPHPVELRPIQTHLVDQPLGVQRPALPVSDDVAVTPERRHRVAEFLCDGELQVMSGDRSSPVIGIRSKKTS